MEAAIRAATPPAPPAPDAGGRAALHDLVLDVAQLAATDGARGGQESPETHAAIDALLSAHAAAVQGAEAAGYARAIGAIDAACHTISAADGCKGVELVETILDIWGVVLPDNGGIMRARIRPTPTAALIDHAAAIRSAAALASDAPTGGEVVS